MGRLDIAPSDWADPLNRALLLDDLRQDISQLLGRDLEPEDLDEAALVISTDPAVTHVDVSVRLAPAATAVWFDVLPGRPA